MKFRDGSQACGDNPPLMGFARAALCIGFGVLLTRFMQGYQFGGSNHTVYFLDALRQAHPDLLQNDWFVTQTLQYHAAFGLLTRAFMTWGITQPAFLGGYWLLLILLHTAWWKLVRLLRGDVAAFVLSEVLFHALAGGTALGMYQFMQDSAFLASNIAAVAMLWGIYFAACGRLDASAAMMGVAGVFHLNYAIVAPVVWFIARIAHQRRLTFTERAWAIGMLELCLMNIIPAAILIHSRGGTPMPLDDFVDLYVRLRHPHHYDPSTWPISLWLSFIAPIPFAFPILRRQPALWEMFQLLIVLLLIALIGAGIWYWSETLIQLSLWRFGIFVKLLSCIGASIWIVERLRRTRTIAMGSALAGAAIMIGCMLRGPYLGYFRIPADSARYAAACESIRRHTPADAVFLVPPGEQEFRLLAQRAIVVNYKAVPQLSMEMDQWQKRLQAVLAASDLRWYRGTFEHTLAAMNARFEKQPPEHYRNVAEQFGARFVLVGHRLGPDWEPRRIDLDGNTSWFLYDLAR
jgi:hypothetical protein